MLRVTHIPGAGRWGELAGRLARARESGMDGIEIVVGDGCTGELSAAQETCIALAREAERCGVSVISVRLADDTGAYVGTGDEDQRLQARERVRAAVRIAGWLGARLLRFVPAASAEGGRWSYQDALNRTYHSLLNLRGDFERGGVIGAIEPCRDRFLLSPPEMRELLDRVNSPWIGAALDWGACVVHGDPLDWAETLQYRLSAVILREPAAVGAIAHLQRIDFEGVAIVEA